MAEVDIAVPCYGYGRFLPGCIESVLAQGIGEVRILVIDNASPDDSLAIARRLAAADRRVDVVAHARNLGATASYNEAVEWAAAEFFVLLDADDLLAPGCLVRALAVMKAHPAIGFTHGFEGVLLADGTLRAAPSTPGEPVWEIIPGRRFIERYCELPTKGAGAPTVVRRTAVQKRAGFYRAELPYSDDVEMWLRLACFGDVATTRAMQGIRRAHAGQMSLAYRSSMVRDFREREAAVGSFFGHEGRNMRAAAALERKARRRLGEHAYWSAVSHLCRGQARESARLFGYALSRSPASAICPPVGWLLRMERPLARIGSVLAEGLRGLLPARPLRPPAMRRHDSRNGSAP